MGFSRAKLIFLFLLAGILYSPEGASASSELEQNFYQAIKHIYSDQYAEASELIGNIKKKGLELGYKSFPEYSYRLLERAQVEYLEKGNVYSNFIIGKAVFLSPDDPKVLL